ncbi:PREDICTED: peptidyl-prolyl cis-trans isomerase E-like [Polistes dominula]|uniref:Peptidyl-prolyl cis-trans isomerase E-like n=1 Tax=Polistes dominula TaxID=743375 RepID=A0ABM1ITR2_POLDO|nr:PREDICTED: peptidyl-prolyl cis-trans isomerase E-like [Polistes dominula]
MTNTKETNDKHEKLKSKQHFRKKEKNIVAKVDNKPPKFNIDVYYKLVRLENDTRRVRELDKQNMDLLRSLNVITRRRGSIDCWLQKVKYKSKLENQHLENKKIMKENIELLKKINEISSQYAAADLIKDWKYLKAKLEIGKKRRVEKLKKIVVAPGMKKDDYCMLSDSALLHTLNPSIRNRCFLEIKDQQSEEILGTIVIELYTDIVPKTCANFEAFCMGVNGLSYRNTPFHRIVPGYWCQGGDVVKFNGIGGTSIYGDSFKDENFHLRHAGPGILSMHKANDMQENNSKFNLTFKTLKTMNGKRVVFGKIVKNLAVIYKIEECGSKSGKPIRSIVISNCGILSSRSNVSK